MVVVQRPTLHGGHVLSSFLKIEARVGDLMFIQQVMESPYPALPDGAIVPQQSTLLTLNIVPTRIPLRL